MDLHDVDFEDQPMGAIACATILDWTLILNRPHTLVHQQDHNIITSTLLDDGISGGSTANISATTILNAKGIVVRGLDLYCVEDHKRIVISNKFFAIHLAKNHSEDDCIPLLQDIDQEADKVHASFNPFHAPHHVYSKLNLESMIQLHLNNIMTPLLSELDGLSARTKFSQIYAKDLCRTAHLKGWAQPVVSLDRSFLYKDCSLPYVSTTSCSSHYTWTRQP